MTKEISSGESEITQPTNNLLYKEKSYAELSSEFRKLFPTAYYAFQLIPQMYNRLTLIDNLSHKAAIARMREDHKDLPGFSGRNIRRYLTTDNPNIPRRVRTPRPKTSTAKLNHLKKLSDTQSVTSPAPVHNNTDCQGCLVLARKNEELQEALKAATKFSTGDTIGKSQVLKVREFRFGIDILDIKKYLTRMKRDQVNVSQIEIITRVDIANETLVSASVYDSENVL